MNDRVIFLDVDGVLVTERTLMGRVGRFALGDQNCVAELNRVTDATGASLVLSSSWRFCGLIEMRLILRHWGVTAPLISMTPDLTQLSGESGLYSGVPRGREIQKWMDENPVAVFAIVDDDADMEHLTPWLVKTNFADGLTGADADRLITMLLGYDPKLCSPHACKDRDAGVACKNNRHHKSKGLCATCFNHGCVANR